MENFAHEGDFDAAFAVLERAHSIAATVDDAHIEPDALELIGMTRCYRSIARRVSFEESLENFDLALAMRERIGDRRGVAETAFHNGPIEQHTGQ